MLDILLAVALSWPDPAPGVIRFVGMAAPAPQCEPVKRHKTFKGSARTLDEAFLDIAQKVMVKGGDTIHLRRVYKVERSSGEVLKRVVKGKAYNCSEVSR